MKVAVYDTHKFDQLALEFANNKKHELYFIKVRLNEKTAVLAAGFEAVCLFANDRANAPALEALDKIGIKLIALRSAGFNHVDIKRASELGMTVVRVPNYSPYAVAEFATALLLTLNRKIHKALNRVHEMNFSLEGLVGFDLHGKTIGVIGTGRIGKTFAQIMRGFGCVVIAYDKAPDEDWAKTNSVQYVQLKDLLNCSDVISLHVPMNESTKHIINDESIGMMKKNVIIINTGRGALVEAKALISALKRHLIAGACLDVYEEEAGIFFSDLSGEGIDDDVLARLLTFPNLLLTSHQAFLTVEALENIASTTIRSITAFETGGDLENVKV